MSTTAKVMVVFVMLAALGMLYMSARTMVTLDNGRRRAVQVQNDIDKAIKDTQDMIEGTDPNAPKDTPLDMIGKLPLDPAPQQGEPQVRYGGYSIYQLRTLMTHLTEGRGRIWKNTTPGQVAGDGTVTVNVTIPEQHQINDRMVLHVFDEASFANGGRYLGEFRVTAAQNGQPGVSLAPTLPLTPAELKLLQDAAGSTWALYETLPHDRHDVFAHLTDEQRQALLPPRPEQRPEEPADQFEARVKDYEQLVTDFMRDGKEIVDNDGTPDDRVAYLVQFQKTDDAAVAALREALEMRAILDADELKKYRIAKWEDFDTAELPKIVKSDQVFEFPKVVADKLVAAEVVRIIGKRYRRPLIDFGVVLSEMRLDRPMIYNRIAELNNDLAKMERTRTDAEKDEEQHRQTKTDMEKEQARLKAELALVQARKQKIAAELKKTKASIAALAKKNQQQARELVEAQKEAARRAEESIQYDQASVSP